MSVTAVVVSYNTCERTLRCVESLVAHGGPQLTSVVVVDNASQDATVERLRGAFPQARVIALGVNVGFAAACNVGVAATATEFVLLLNPDTEMAPGCVDALVDALHRKPGAGLIGGRTVDERGGLDPHSCWAQPSLWSLLCFATGLSTLFSQHRVFDPESMGSWQRDDEREVGVVTGCLLLCSHTVWDELHGMDSTYFVYGEDVDFSFRARALGYRPMITPGAEIMHVRGAASASADAKWAMILRGKVTFMSRCWDPRRARIGVALLVAGTALRAVAVRCGLPVAGPWRRNWRSREEWLRGWEGTPPVAVQVTSDSGFGC